MSDVKTYADEKVQNAWEMNATADCGLRQDFIERFENDTAFYFHQQYTRDQKTRLRTLKQMDITVDRVRPIIRRVVSKIVRSRPMIAALTIDPQSKDISKMINAQAQYSMRVSKGLGQIRKAITNTVRGGLSFLMVYVDNSSADGLGEVKFKYISPKKVFVDPASQDMLFDDARYVQILEKIMVWDAIKLFAADNDEELADKIIGGANTSHQDELVVDDYSDVGRIAVGSGIESFMDSFNAGEEMKHGYMEALTTYTKLLSPVYYAATRPDENSEVVRISIADDEIKKYEGVEGVRIEKGYKRAIKEHVCNDGFTLSEQVLDFVEYYPITPLVWEDTENPYPVSETFFIRGHQMMGNAFWRTVLSNAQASSFPTVFAEENVFVDDDKAANAIATPGGIVKLKTGALVAKRIQQNYAQPLNQAFFTLLQFIQHEQEYQASTPAIQQGDPTNAPETNKALVNMDSFADRVLAMNTDAIELAIERLFINIIRFQNAVYDDDKLMLIDINPENNMTMNETETDVDDEGNLVSKRKNINMDLVKYDVSIVPGSMSPLDKTSEFQYAMAAVELGAPPEYAISKMPITDAVDIIEDMSTIRKLKEGIQKYQEMLDELQKHLQAETQRADKAEKDVVDSRYQAKFEIELKELQSKVSSLNKELRTAERQNKINLQKSENIAKKTAQTLKESAEKE